MDKAVLEVWPEESAKTIRKVGISMDEPTSVMALIARTDSVMVVDDAANDPRSQKWLVALFQAKSFVTAPIVSDAKVIGIVAVGEIRRILHLED
ncbi:MAG: GAF domain-containing protein [Actinomycetia bacterium]|nr:GAF domain-containing protein [Actinomycetes bacterium]